MSYFIKNIKYGISGGPLDSIVVTTVEYKNEKENKFLSVVDLNGIFEFHLSDDDIYDDLINENMNKKVESSFITSFNDIDLDKLSELNDKFDDDSLLIKYLMIVLRIDEDDAEELINKTKNNYLTKEVIEDYDFDELL